MDTAEPSQAQTVGHRPVVLYWRPGCPYCVGLRRRLRQLGVATTEVNIWADPAAAETVRAHAGGNETVPIVAIGDTVMVNPTGPQVLEVARRLAPHALTATVDSPRRRPGRPRLASACTVTLAAIVMAVVLAVFGRPVLAAVLVGLVAVFQMVQLQLARRHWRGS